MITSKRKQEGQVKDAKKKPSLVRVTLSTSRLLDFCNRKEMIAQTGHQPDAWPLVILKELIDNALDACEEAGIAPVVSVEVDRKGITVKDNGPGIPVATIKSILDFSVRVSSREAYIAPDRGAQGNALKTVVAMPFVLDGKQGRVKVESRGVEHEIVFSVDSIRQEPVIDHQRRTTNVKTGTIATVLWPNSACSILVDAKARFLQIAEDFAWLNPHLALTVQWFKEQTSIKATDPKWQKWGPSEPTSSHWYAIDHFERLIAGYITHDSRRGNERTIREFVSEFRGLSGTAKQREVLEVTGLSRAGLSDLRNGTGLDRVVTSKLLEAMKTNSKLVKPQVLGIIGKGHFKKRLETVGCEMESFEYRKVMGTTDSVPWIVETAFGWCPEGESRRLITGVNWSPGIVNPFRALGPIGQSMDTVLSQQRADQDEPVIVVLHMACPRVEYTDRGKSAVVVED